MDWECNAPAWGENLDTTRLCSMIEFSNTGNKKSLLLFLFKLQTLTGVHIHFRGWIITIFLTLAIKTFFSPMAWIPPSFLFSMLSSMSVQLLLSPLSLLRDLLPCILTDLFSTAYLVILSTDDLLILILPFWSIFSSIAALVLVDALLSFDVLLLLVDGGLIGWGVFSHASLSADFIVFPEKDHISLLFLVILPVLLFPDHNDPVVVDSDVTSVILNSGLDSFCVSGLILCTVSSEAAKVSWTVFIVSSSSCIVSVWVLLLQSRQHWNDYWNLTRVSCCYSCVLVICCSSVVSD